MYIQSVIKVNLIYPVIKEVSHGQVDFYSKEFDLRVQVFDDDILSGISEIKKLMILSIMELSKEGQVIPMPSFEGIESKEIAYIEIDSDYVKVNTERVNMTIPKNLLALIDSIGLNRSNYVSNLIWQDIFKKINK